MRALIHGLVFWGLVVPWGALCLYMITIQEEFI
jgi:hypothetical protein